MGCDISVPRRSRSGGPQGRYFRSFSEQNSGRSMGGSSNSTISSRNEKKRKKDSRKESKNAKIPSPPPDEREKDVSDIEMALALNSNHPITSAIKWQQTFQPGPQRTNSQTRHRTNGSTSTERPRSTQNPAVRESNDMNSKTQQKQQKLSSGLVVNVPVKSNHTAGKNNSNYIEIDNLPQPLLPNSKNLNFKDLPTAVHLNTEEISNNVEMSRANNDHHIINMDNVNIKEKNENLRREYFKDILISPEETETTEKTGHLEAQNGYGSRLRTENQNFLITHSTPVPPLISEQSTAFKNTQQLANFARNSFSSSNNAFPNNSEASITYNSHNYWKIPPTDPPPLKPERNYNNTLKANNDDSNSLSNTNFEDTKELANSSLSSRGDVINNYSENLEIAYTTDDQLNNSLNLLNAEQQTSIFAAANSSSRELEAERSSIKLAERVQIQENGFNLLEEITENLLPNIPPTQSPLQENRFKSLPPIPINIEDTKEIPNSSLSPREDVTNNYSENLEVPHTILTEFERKNSQSITINNSLNAEQQISQSEADNSSRIVLEAERVQIQENGSNLQEPIQNNPPTESLLQENQHKSFPQNPMNFEVPKEIANSSLSPRGDVASNYPENQLNFTEQQRRKDIIKFLRSVRDKAVPFEVEIDDFTELENSNKYYYIEKSLTRLIDKLDDMHEIINEDSDLRSKRKDLYKYIFYLLDLLDKKVENNKKDGNNLK